MLSKQAVERIADNRQTQKEQEILEVASRSFLQHGYDGTSINAMARESGISKESIYRYFDSKKALFEAVIAKELAKYQSQIHFLDVDLDRRGLEDDLISTAETILGVVGNDRTQALRRLIFQEVARYPEIGQYYYEIGPGEAYKHLARVFELHRDRTDFAPETLAEYFVAMVLHNTVLRRQCGMAKRPDRKTLGDTSRRVTRDFLKAFFRD